MIILSVDYGDVRTGIAVCDKLEILASPVCVITERNQQRLIEKISTISAEKKAEMIIVGLPKNMDSSEGERAQKCIALGNELSLATGLPVVMRDERLSTVSAHNILNATNTRGKNRKAVVDSVAAVIILQDYLDFRKINNIK